MDFLTEDISRIKEIMGIDELPEENSAKEGEIEEQEDSGGGETGGSTGGSTSSAKSWESGRKMGKTYGGHNYVWKSDRTMGKTYSGDPKSKWESGASRGKANPLT
jgi:hypothetical protein